MYRILGTSFVCLLMLVALSSSPALAYDSPQKYGVEFRGGFGLYDMGDVTTGMEAMQAAINSNRDRAIPNKYDKTDTGPMGGISFLFRPSRHTMWEVGFNSLMDVENKLETTPDTSEQILMHANEFFMKGTLVATLSDRIHLDFGAGFSYYNAELQIQHAYGPTFVYDAVGRSWGLLGTVGLEFLLTERLGLLLQGGGRLTNVTHFNYESNSVYQELNYFNSTRPMEVNLTGGFASLGLRVYFDKVTKPVDFTR
ncbi:MAG: hypothetical protein ACOZB3_01860 [Calditrichota bacterium]